MNDTSTDLTTEFLQEYEAEFVETTEAVTQQMQMRALHEIVATPAVFVNAFQIGTAGSMVRVTFGEGAILNMQPHNRAALVMAPADLQRFLDGGAEVLSKMTEAGLWAPPDAKEQTS